MRGISTIIAALLMLVLTIALAGLAYTLLFAMPAVRGLVLSLVDSYCSAGTARWTVRNDGTANITAAAQTLVSVDEACTTDPTPVEIGAGRAVTLTATGCTGGRTHIYRLTGPANALQLLVYCP